MPSAGSASVPAWRAIGFPSGLRALKSTDDGSISRKLASAANSPGCVSTATWNGRL